MHKQHMQHINIVNRLEANEERFRPERFDQIRPHSIQLRGIKSNEIDLREEAKLRSLPTQARHDCEKIAITGLEPASQDRSS